MKFLYFTFESQNVFELSQTHIHSIQDKDHDNDNDRLPGQNRGPC